MSATPLDISVPLEDMSPCTRFILDAASRDKTALLKVYTKYDGKYFTAMESKFKLVDGLINPVQLTSDISRLTKDIYKQQALLTPALVLLEGYLNRAVGLTVDVKYFGISAVRKENHSGNIEGLIRGMKTMLDLVDKNDTQLTAQGWTVAQRKAMGDIVTALETDNAGQNAKMEEKALLVENNHVAINAFWADVMDLCDAGKRVFKTAATSAEKLKVKDYTIRVLVKRLHNDKLKNKFVGVVKVNGQPVAGAKIDLLPTGVGKKRTGKSNATGEFELSGITVADYVVNVILKGYTTLTDDVTIEQGKTTMMDFDFK